MSADMVREILPDAPICGTGVLMYNGEGDVMHILHYSGCPYPATGIVEYDTSIQPEFSICFGPNTPFTGQELVPKLSEITSEVERAIKSVLNAKP